MRELSDFESQKFEISPASLDAVAGGYGGSAVSEVMHTNPVFILLAVATAQSCQIWCMKEFLNETALSPSPLPRGLPCSRLEIVGPSRLRLENASGSSSAAEFCELNTNCL